MHNQRTDADRQRELLDRYFKYVHEKAKGMKKNAPHKIYKT